MKLRDLALTLVVATLLLPLSLQAKNEMKKAYLFGFAYSFNDSIVYFTDIQEMDSLWFTSKQHFLVNRDNYAYQLRDFLSSIGQNNRTCIVEYAFKRKDIEKKWNKLNTRYSSNSKTRLKQEKKHKEVKPPFQIKNLVNEEFMFQPIAPTEEETLEEQAKVSKKEKKAKGKKGDHPAPPQDGQQPPMSGGGMPPRR